MADLPISGVQLVVQNAKQAIGDLNAFQKALGQQNKALATVAKSSTNTSRFMSAFNKDLGSIAQNALRAVPGLGKFSSLLTSVGSSGATAAAGTSALGASMAAALPVIGAVVVSVGAATAGLYAFWQAGVRGAQLQPVIDAFGNLAGQFGDSNEILQRLRDQTKGTISDMNLMRIATFALSGTSQELGTIFAENLGKNLNDISRLATAIGRDPVEAQNRWIDALKKGERELLDELGIVVSANQAYEAYAKGINKSVAELTAYDKQAAFAQEATRQLNEAVAKLPDQSGILVTLQRIPVAIQNIMDRIALVIQPLFVPIAGLVGDIVALFERGFTGILMIVAPIFKTIGVIISETIGVIKEIIAEFFGDFNSTSNNNLAYIVASFQIAGDVITFVFRAIAASAKQTVRLLSEIFKRLIEPLAGFFGILGQTTNSTLAQLAFNLGKGGAQIIGAFAAGIIRGGTYVLQAVTQIAQIVADFLMGFSPPKRGVLHNIDKGAENVATSWVDGFLGGIQKSFGEVLGYVNDRLGEIASLSRDQIETRLAQLDIALRPFKENLAIVKADMEAIAGFTDPAMKIMERQRTALLKAFGRGDSSLDVERLRTQDRQIQRLKELKELGQDQVDQAELQLALANSQQTQERALLGIALDRMGTEEKIGDVSEKAAKASSDAMDRAKGGGGAAKPGDAGANLPFGQGEQLDLFGSAAIDAAKQNILNAIGQLPDLANSAMAGVKEGLAGSGFSDALAGFNSQKGALGTQLGRIGKSNPVQAIAKKFDGLKDAVSGALGGFKEFIETTFEDLFGENGSVSKALDSVRNKILSVFTGDGNPLEAVRSAFLSLQNDVIDPVIKYLFSDPDGVVIRGLNSIRNKFDEVFGGGTSPLDTAQTKLTELKDNLENIFKPIFEFDLTDAAQTIFTVVTGVFDQVKTLVDGLDTNATITGIKASLQNIVTGILDSVKIIDVDSFVSGFEDVLTRIKNAIESFPTETITKGVNIASAFAGIAMRSIGNVISGGGDDGGGDQQNETQQSTQNLLAGLEISLPEETRVKLQEVGRQITASIATGIAGEESILAMTTSLTTLYTLISEKLTAMFIGEESILFQAQTGMLNFVAIVVEQLELMRASFETSTASVDTYLRSVFLNEDGTIPSIPLTVQSVMDQVIEQFFRMSNDGEGTLKGALSGFGDALRTAMILPMVTAAESVANAVVEALNNVIKQFNRLPIPIEIPLLQHIRIQVPGMAKGTLDALNNPFMAGERGRELIVPSRNNPLSVFPNKATMALDRIGGLMQRMGGVTAAPPKPQPMSIYLPPQASSQNTNNNTHNNNSNNRTVNQNFQYRPTKLELAQMRANS